jgi:hypothetical protein
MKHLTVEAILAYVEGLVASEGNVDVAAKAGAGASREPEAHLESCARCRDLADEIGSLVRFLGEDRRNEPPEEDLNWSLRLFQPVLAPVRRPGGILQIARRVFDSAAQLQAGVRNVGSAPRQLLYRSGPVDIDLRIESVEGGIALAGQLLSEADSFPAQTEVRLEAGGAVRFTTSTNAVGEFSFDKVPDDTYHLALELPEGEIRLFLVNRASS